jgi:hypothetical protein
MNEAEIRWLKKAFIKICILCICVGAVMGGCRALEWFEIIPDGTCPPDHPGTRWESTDGTAWFEVTENKQCYGEIETEQGVRSVAIIFGNGYYSWRSIRILPREAVENCDGIEISRTIWSGVALCTRTKVLVEGRGKNDLFPEEKMTLEFMRMETE